VRVIALALAFCLELPAFVFGECPTIQTLVQYQPSRENIKITTLIGRKGAKGVRVDVVLLTGSPTIGLKVLYSLLSDDDGVVTPPALSPGRYQIQASTATGLVAALFLEVSTNGERSLSNFSVSLEPDPAGIWNSVKAAEGRPPRESIDAFRGIIRDSDGVAVPGVRIEMWSVSAPDDASVSEAVADKDGRFAIDLADGIYVALFRLDGFQDHFLTLEIRRNHRPNELRISMVKGITVYVC